MMSIHISETEAYNDGKLTVQYYDFILENN